MTESTPARRLAWLAQVLASLRTITTNLLVLAVLIAIIGAALWEARQNAIVIDPIEVPKDLAEKGYSPGVVAQRLGDEIRAIYEAASGSIRYMGTRLEQPVPVPPGDRPDVQVPGSAVTITSAVRYANYVLGRPETHISGAITREDRDLQLVVRSSARSNPSAVVLSAGSLDELLKRGAQAVVKMNKPYVLAWYFYHREKEGREFKETQQMIKYCLENTPEHDRWAYTLWGAVLSRRGDFHAAIRKYELALRGQPNFALPYAYWGLALEELAQHQQAIEKYQTATDINPNDAASYTNWGNVLTQELQRHREAIENYEKAIRIAPREAVLYSNWCNALNGLGRHGDAIKKCQDAIDIDPGYAPAYHNWGVALERMKKYDEAIQQYKQATELDPRLFQPYLGWANALRALGRREEADSKSQKADELSARAQPTSR